MLVTGTNVLAGGGDKEDSKSPEVSKALPVINVAVVGDEDEIKENFIKSYTRIQGSRYYGVQSYRLTYKEKTIKFFDIPSDLGEGSDNELEKKWINNFLKSSKRNRNVPYCTYVIICLNVETEKEELVKRAYEWLKEIKERNKDYQMKLVLYSVTDENVSNYHDKAYKIRILLDHFESEFMKKYPEIEQFRSCSGFPVSAKNILDDILDGSNIYIESVSSRNVSKSVSNISMILSGVLVAVGIVIFKIFYISKR